jgi:alcohol dehydrogenase class IV
MSFEFSMATRILFGEGRLSEVASIAASKGNRAFILTDSYERVEKLIKSLLDLKMSFYIFVVKNEPTINIVLMAIRILRESIFDVIISMGGGSTIDAGKAANALAVNPGDPLGYFEVIGSGDIIKVPPLPFIAIPTTAGTGSEVTRNSVISFPEKGIKVSLRSPFLQPTVAVVDPELSYSMPPKLTASTGFDALTQVIEPFICNASTPLTDTFCRAGIFLGSKSLLLAYNNGNNRSARQDMSLVSLFGGLALSNARLGAVHGLAGPLGGLHPIPHGVICACLLPLVMEANFRAMRSRMPNSPILIRFTEIAQLLTGKSNSDAGEAITFLFELKEKLSIPHLGKYGLVPDEIPKLIEQAQNSSSMKGNPIKLSDLELISILEQAI